MIYYHKEFIWSAHAAQAIVESNAENSEKNQYIKINNTTFTNLVLFLYDVLPGIPKNY